tara:strand:- start:273 stop:392 length:120 start_codon:yes stop_codon:yes gene_type:complete
VKLKDEEKVGNEGSRAMGDGLEEESTLFNVFVVKGLCLQ